MAARKLRIWLLAVVAVVATSNLAGALGFRLGETKEQLELKYDVDCTVHGSGRVTVNLTIVEQGRIKPIHDVQLAVPSDDGTGNFDPSLSMATDNIDGKLRARAHMSRELAERATIRLVTRTSPDTGKELPRTWFYHLIPISEYIRDGEQKPN